MKAKRPIYFTCTNVTDDFVMTDVWDKRHYDMKQELAVFQDKETFAECKDQNFAQTFLAHAEEMIEKKGDVRPDTRSLIEELRRETKNYDAWRIFMQTLRLVTIVYRTGSIPEVLQAGAVHIQKNVGGGKLGGKESGKGRREKAEPIKEAWQSEAEKIWRRRPAKSNAQVGKEVGELIGGNPDTIRKRIKKPLP